MNIIQVIILSISEGLTEFLPVSSTGHLILAEKLLSIPNTEFVKSFDIIIQLGAILAVVVYFYKKLLNSVSMWPKIIAAFLPTAVIGFLLYKIIKKALIGNELVTVLALGIGGLLFISIEYYMSKRTRTPIASITIKQAVLIGLLQTFSVIPGVSRSAASIFGALLVGAPREAAVEFSFFLAIPTMIAASGYDLMKTGFSFSQQEFLLIALGFFISFIVALGSISFLTRFVKTHSFLPFGIYRIVLAFIYGLFFLQ